MSWDVVIQDLPEGIESVSEIPDDFRPAELGKRAEYIAAIQSFLPKADFSDPAWGVFEDGGVSIEFSMGTDEELHSIGLHIRGGPDAPALVARLLRHLVKQALDLGSGDLFRFGDETAAGFKSSGNYRDKVTGKDSEP